MRLYEVDDPALNEMLEKITDECSDILELYHTLHRMLFRGVKTGAPPYFERTPREDRKNLHSNSILAGVFDDYLASKGFTALRRNSMFCTNSISHAESFGAVYVVFPKNGFTYTWTKRPDIVFNPTQVERNLDMIKLNQAEMEAEKHPNENGERWRWIEGLPVSTNLKRLKQFGIPGYENPNEATFLDVSKFMKFFSPKRTNIEAALSRDIGPKQKDDGYEICIRGPYYAVSLDYSEAIEKLVGVSPTAANDAVWARHEKINQGY